MRIGCPGTPGNRQLKGGLPGSTRCLQSAYIFRLLCNELIILDYLGGAEILFPCTSANLLTNFDF